MNGVAWLRLDADDAVLTLLRPGRPERAFVWPLGTARLAAVARLQDPPRPIQLEAAIAEVENHVMAAAHEAAGIGRLVLPPATFAQILRMTALAGVPRLSLEQLEAAFNTLVAVAEGRPAGSSGIATDTASVATLVLVRELMHHLVLEILEPAS